MKTVLSSVIGAMILAVATPAQAQDQLDNSGIQFDVDTVIEFEFVESHAAYQSTFGVVNLDTGERTPLLREIKPADRPQSVVQPSDFTDDTLTDDASDFLGTPGNAVPEPLAEFVFQANTRYAFYLESTYNGQPAGIFYSTDTENPSNRRRLQFDGDFTQLGEGGVTLRWDDTGSLLVNTPLQDQDFDDFVIRAGGHLDCPYGEQE